jgi:ketose-bisphosphate aldolase
MPLEPVRALIHQAVEARYALGYFESWNLESLQGVIDAAEQSRSPILIGFNGDFLSRRDRRAEERLGLYAALVRAAAASATVPCGVVFNECPHDDWIRAAVVAGFGLVMPADPEAPYDDYVRRVRELSQFAHERGVAVEAEVGELPSGASADDEHVGSPTDPELAAEFVAATGVDLLAVSVGNVHIRVDGQDGLDLRRLEQIHQRVAVPLVLHGGTGIEADALRQAIGLGVAKVNYGTYLKQAYLAAVREALARDIADPHRLLGIGGPEDVLVAGRLAVRDAVLARIELLGCCGRADATGSA